MTINDSPELRRAIARAVLDDLEDRRGIKWELEGVKEQYPETYAEIERALAAAVMRVLHKHDTPKELCASCGQPRAETDGLILCRRCERIEADKSDDEY